MRHIQRSILLLICLTVLFASFVGAQKNQSSDLFSNVLYDFIRTEHWKYAEVKLSTQQERKILLASLGRYKKQGQCPGIDQEVKGSFTAPKVQEVAYVVRCSTPNLLGSVNNQNDSRLVILQGNKIVVNVRFYGIGIAETFDLNQDGIQELLLYGGWTWMGEDATTAQLVEVKNRRLRIVKDFKQLENAYMCDSEQGDAGRKNISAIINYTQLSKGKLPSFRVDYYEGDCPDTMGKEKIESFHFVQSDKFPE